jgi:hypothetical protein
MKLSSLGGVNMITYRYQAVDGTEQVLNALVVALRRARASQAEPLADFVALVVVILVSRKCVKEPDVG